MTKKRGRSANQGRSDQDILNLFIEKIRELAATSLGQTGIFVSHRVSYTPDGVVTKLDQSDEEAVRSFLLTFRQFVAEKEPLFLGRVYGICYRRLEDEVLRDRIKQTREIWASVRRGRGASIVINGVEFYGDKIFDLWVNGYYFHSDEEYKRILDQADPLTKGMFRAQFVSFIIDISRLLQDLGQVILNGFAEDPAKPDFILLPSA